MKSVDIGVLPNSICFSFTPPEIARQLYFYPTWCGRYFCSSRYYMKRNSYPPLLVIYVRRGILNVEYRGERRQAREGDVVLLDCTEPHYYHAENNLEFLYMHYDGSNAHEITRHIINLHGWLFRREDLDEEGNLVRDSRNERVNILLQDMVYLYEHNHAETMFESSARIYKLFEILLSPSTQEQKDELPITAAVEYIRANVGKPITLEELADIAKLSPYYFSHMFRDCGGSRLFLQRKPHQSFCQKSRLLAWPVPQEPQDPEAMNKNRSVRTSWLCGGTCFCFYDIEIACVMAFRFYDIEITCVKPFPLFVISADTGLQS